MIECRYRVNLYEKDCRGNRGAFVRTVYATDEADADFVVYINSGMFYCEKVNH